MKKFVCAVMVLVLCLSLACPVFAAEDDFVPSISIKEGPELVPVEGDDGKLYLGYIKDQYGNILGLIDEDCLVITSVGEVMRSRKIPAAAAEMLLWVYDELVAGTMELPYEKFNKNLDPDKMVIRELVDATWLCSDHPDIVAPAGVHVELTFNLGVGADTEVYVMSYKHDQWNPIVSTVNNDNGTVTCVFEDFCPIAFSVYAGSSTNPPVTGDNANMTLWVVLLAVSTLALVAVVVVRRKVAR